MIRSALLSSSSAVLLALGAPAAEATVAVEIVVVVEGEAPATMIYEILVDNTLMGETDAAGRQTITVDTCTRATRIRIRSKDPFYSSDEQACDPVPVTLTSTQLRYSAVIRGEHDGPGVGYAAFLLPALDGSPDLVALLDARDFAAASAVAREAGDSALREGDPVLAEAYHLLALDAGFRAEKCDPLSERLIEVAEFGFPVLSREGDRVLAEIAPDWLPPVAVEGGTMRAGLTLVTGPISACWPSATSPAPRCSTQRAPSSARSRA